MRTQAVDRRPEILLEIRLQLRGQFQYIDLQDAELLYIVWTGFSGWVCVVGHPEHGSYEWVARHDADFDGQSEARYEHSDSGYGVAAAALRDGLNKILDE